MNNFKTLPLTIFPLLFIIFLVNPISGNPYIHITEDINKLNIGEYVEILEDPSGKLTLEDVQSPVYDSLFTLSKSPVPNFGFTNSAYWLRFKIKNEVETEFPWAIELGFANMHYADFYQITDGKLVKESKTGVLRPIKTRDYKYHHLVYLLTLPVGNEHQVYMRFKNEASMTLKINFYSINAFMDVVQKNLFRTGIFFGVLLIMFGYNLFLFYTLEDRSYLYFAFFIAGLSFFGATYEGLASVYIWPNFHFLIKVAVPLFNGILLIALLLFTDTFLELKIRQKIWHKIYMGLIILTGFLSLLVPFVAYGTLIKPMVILTAIILLLVLANSLIAWIKGYRPARYFLLSLLVVLLSSSTASFVRLGLLPSTSWTEPQYFLGTILMVFLITQALTDRIKLLREKKEAIEQDLHESESIFRQFFEELPEAILLTRISGENRGEILDANPAAEHQMGVKREQLIGMNVLKDFVIDDSEAVDHDKNDQELLAGKTIQFVEKKKKEDGEEYWTRVKITQIKSRKQNIALSINTDITRQKKAEDALYESEASLKALINAIPNPAFLIDKNYKLLVANKALAEGFNKNIEKIINTDAFRLLPSDLSRDRKNRIDQVFANGRQLVFEDSRAKEFYINYIYPVHDTSGEVTRVAIFALDITERKLLENQLAQAQKMESIGTLAGGIAHDFNNLLTVINGYADLALSRVDKSDKTYHDINEIRSASTRAENLTRQILAFSRKQIYQPKSVNLNQIIIGMEKMVRRLIGEDIEIEKHLGANIPSIKADPVQLEQILINLLVNARDAINEKTKEASQKKISIKTAPVDIDQKFINNHPGSKEGPHICFGVTDSGIGMTNETRQKIFDPFFTMKDKGKGTGLGLSTVYGIVKQNNASIYTESEPEKGTTFEIFWPVTTEVQLEEEAERVSEKSLEGKEMILFVEDNEQVCEFAVAALKDFGYTVVAIDNGIEALKVVEKEQFKPDLVITDLVMPKMNGKELAEKLTSSFPHIKIIFTSGYAEDHLVHEGELESHINFVEKPYTFNNLLNKIREILDSD